jgi:hypothetical protein
MRIVKYSALDLSEHPIKFKAFPGDSFIYSFNKYLLNT